MRRERKDSTRTHAHSQTERERESLCEDIEQQHEKTRKEASEEKQEEGKEGMETKSLHTAKLKDRHKRKYGGWQRVRPPLYSKSVDVSLSRNCRRGPTSRLHNNKFSKTRRENVRVGNCAATERRYAPREEDSEIDKNSSIPRKDVTRCAGER